VRRSVPNAAKPALATLRIQQLALDRGVAARATAYRVTFHTGAAVRRHDVDDVLPTRSSSGT
jgi:hypothetical protein